MEGWDNEPNGDVAPKSFGRGRGALASILGNKMRGIGRGTGGNSEETNGFKGRSSRFGDSNNNSKMNGFSSNDEEWSGFGGGRSRGVGFGNQSRGGDSGNRRQNDWTCPDEGCGAGNFAYRKKCFKCDTLKPGGDDDSSSGSGFGGRSKGFGGGGRERRGGDWTCPDSECGANNFASRNACFKCSTPKPDGSDDGGSGFGRNGGFGGRSGGFGGSGGGREKRDGDWTCPDSDCGANNFASRSVCFKCSKPKPSNRGESKGGGSRGSRGGGFGGNGGFGRSDGGDGGGRDKRAGEWVCPDESCGNKNFSFRKVCQKCDTPKPGGSPRNGDDKSREAPYIPPELSNNEEDMFGGHCQKGINFDKYDEISVEVSGNNPVDYINDFVEAGLYPTFLTNLQRAKYDRPTPIQKYSIPIISAGRDLMACAQTGSGKTAAFLLPVLTSMITNGLTSDQHQEVQTPQAICVAPTRELAMQIFSDCRKFAYQTEVRAVVLYGGTSVGHQMRQVEKGANFVIGTPGRLLDVINRGKISLAKVSYLILDEADRMLDMGFEPEIRKLVETMGMPSKFERHTLMFSATFPVEIQKLAGDFLNDYLFVTVGRVGGANTDVQQNFFEVDRLQKRESLCDILSAGGNEKTLVFVEQKRNADFLASYLCQSGFQTTSIHGDRLQREREEALQDFKTGKAVVLVATSVAARGLDIPEVMHVVNYDLPTSIDEYVHRIGRTGRCGNLGKATSFFNADTDQEMAANLVRVLKDAQQVVPPWLTEHASGMGAGDAGGFSGRFGGKDIRRGKFDKGSSNGGGNNWAAGTGVNNASDDEDWD